MRVFIIILLVTTLGCSTSSSLINDVNSNSRLVKNSSVAGSNLFQLADPILSIENRLFTKNTTASLILNYPNTNIYYTLDGSEPNKSSNQYIQELTISKSGTLKAKAFHPNHPASNTVTATFLKIEKSPIIDEISLSTKPHINYAGKGEKSLFDQEKGGLNFRTNKWLGFSGEDVEIVLNFQKKSNINQLTVSTLSDMGSWIFPPSAIEIWAMNDTRNYELIEKKSYEKSEKMNAPNLLYLTLDFSSKSVKNLKIIVRNNGLIPEWHDGKGTPAWLFLDEIILQ